jgi:hypothetical protein
MTGIPSLVAPISGAASTALAVAAPAQADDDTTETGDESVPTVTVNEFLPTDRDLSECLSALPRPGCGSEARGGWRQTAIFVAMLGGLAFIAWRIIASSQRARAALAEARPTDVDPTA